MRTLQCYEWLLVTGCPVHSWPLSGKKTLGDGVHKSDNQCAQAVELIDLTEACKLTCKSIVLVVE